MINFLVFNILSISEWFQLPKTIGEVTPLQWVIVFIAVIFILLLFIKVWQKLVIFLIKLVLFAFVILLVYLLVVGW